MRCDDVSILLSESAESGVVLPRAITRHTDHCLRCQAEAAQFRRIRRTMISMRDSYVDPGMGMVADIMNTIRDQSSDDLVHAGVGQLGDRQHGDRRRAAYVAAAAATAAGAAGALVLAARSKRPAS